MRRVKKASDPSHKLILRLLLLDQQCTLGNSNHTEDGDCIPSECDVHDLEYTSEERDDKRDLRLGDEDDGTEYGWMEMRMTAKSVSLKVTKIREEMQQDVQRYEQLHLEDEPSFFKNNSRAKL